MELNLPPACSPSPLRGGGRGERSALATLRRPLPPSPPPRSGEGEPDEALRSADPAAGFPAPATLPPRFLCSLPPPPAPPHACSLLPRRDGRPRAAAWLSPGRRRTPVARRGRGRD